MRYAIFVLVFLSTAFAFAQETQPLSEKVQVEMLQVPVWVTDQNGAPVTTLKKEDLQISENGVAKTDYYLDEISYGKANEAQQPFPQSVLILLDAANISRSALKSVKDSLLRTFKDAKTTPLPLGIAITTPGASYKLVQDYTTDAQQLTAQFSKLDQYLLPDSDRASRAERLNQDDHIQQCSGMRAEADTTSSPQFRSYDSQSGQSRCVEEALKLVSISARQAAHEETYNAMKSWAALAKVCDAAASVPGYKHVIFLSDGVDSAGTYFINYAVDYMTELTSRYALRSSRTTNLIQDLQREKMNNGIQQQALEQVSQNAALSRTVVHWINTQFGRSLSQSVEQQSSAGVSSGQSAQGVSEILSTVALQTGGRVIGASKKDSAEIITDLSKLYVISVPLKSGEGARTRHEIRIASQNKAYHLYYPLSIPVTPAKRNAANVAVSFPSLGNTLNLSNEINYFQKKKGQYYVILRANVPYAALDPAKKGSNIADQLEFHFRVDGNDGKSVLDKIQKVDLKSSAAEFQAQQQTDVALEYVQSLELKSGTYNVAISVTEGGKPNSTAAQKTSLELPAESADCLKLSPLMLASSVAPGTENVSSPKVNDKGQILYGTNVYSLQSKRALPATGTLNGFYEVYNASIPSVFITFRLYQDGKKISETTEREIAAYTRPDDQIISNFFSVPYKNLQAGKYEFEIGVRQTKNDCKQASRIAFEVVQTPSS